MAGGWQSELERYPAKVQVAVGEQPNPPEKRFKQPLKQPNKKKRHCSSIKALTSQEVRRRTVPQFNLNKKLD